MSWLRVHLLHQDQAPCPRLPSSGRVVSTCFEIECCGHQSISASVAPLPQPVHDTVYDLYIEARSMDGGSPLDNGLVSPERKTVVKSTVIPLENMVKHAPRQSRRIALSACSDFISWTSTMRHSSQPEVPFLGRQTKLVLPLAFPLSSRSSPAFYLPALAIQGLLVTFSQGSYGIPLYR